MLYGLPESIFDALQKAFVNRPEIEKVVLYGSRARGDYHAASDIDIAVFTTDSRAIGLWSELDEAAGIYKVDLVYMNDTITPELKKAILEQGVEIYRRRQAGE